MHRFNEEDRGFRPQRSFAPVKVGDELEVTIEAVGEKGDGVAKVKGFVLFVPGTKQGEIVKVQVTKVLKKVGFAQKVGAGSAPAEETQSDDTEPAETEEEPAESEELEEESSESSEPVEDTEDFGEDE
jgi:predicted RNA-binding protein with TRAM domain